VVAKNKRDRAGLRRAGQATGWLLHELARRAEPGVTTGSLDAYAAEQMRRLGGEPVFRTQNGFPGCINTSLNDEAVHGVPGSRTLRAGDLLKIDCGMKLAGYCGDSTITLGIGPADQLPEGRRAVMEVAREALRLGVAAVRAGGHAGDLGHAMQRYVEAAGFRLLREYTGHGLGRRLWEAPSIPAVGEPGTGAPLVEGLVFTIEPIVVGSGAGTYVADDGWTVVTTDGTPSAQFEHTVIATRHGAEVLSQLPAPAA
jgi:methionyl aminopeptidase